MDSGFNAAYGALLGACVGDAAGAFVEFSEYVTQKEVRTETQDL